MATSWSNSEIEKDLRKLLKIDPVKKPCRDKVGEVQQLHNKNTAKHERSSKRKVRYKPLDLKAFGASPFVASNGKHEITSKGSHGVTATVGSVKANDTFKETLETEAKHAVDVSLQLNSCKKNRTESRLPSRPNAFLNAIEATAASNETKGQEELVNNANPHVCAVTLKDESRVSTDIGNEKGCEDFRLLETVFLDINDAVKELKSRGLHKFDARLEECSPLDVMAILEAHHVFENKKESSVSKKRYVCRLCAIRCATLTDCVIHLDCKKHHNRNTEFDRDVFLEHLPVASEAQVKCIEELLLSIVSEFELGPQRILKRAAIIDELNALLKDVLTEGGQLVMYGSSASGVGLKDCDLNIGISMKENMDEELSILRDAYQIFLSEKRLFLDLKMVLIGKKPAITFTHARSNVSCVFCTGNAGSLKTTELIKSYMAFDDRAKALAIALRHWAKVCRLNGVNENVLPKHTLDLMVIFFLQHRNPPVLPVFHQLASNNETFDPSAIKTSWQTQNTESLGNLWIEFFRFYALIFPKSECVANIRQFSPMSRSSKDWKGRLWPIADPYYPKEDMCRSSYSTKNFGFLVACLKLSFKYFGVPQLQDGPLFSTLPKSLPSLTSCDLIKEVADCSDTPKTTKTYVTIRAKQKSEVSSECSNNNIESDHSTDESESLDTEILQKAEPSEQQNDFAGKNTCIKVISDSESQSVTEVGAKDISSNKDCFELERRQLPSVILKQFYSVTRKEMNCCISRKDILSGRTPVIECCVCKLAGHSEDKCPELILPPIDALPEMQPFFLELISQACLYITGFLAAGDNDFKERQSILSELKAFIKNVYVESQLSLFGSSCSGFGFKKSDLDICLTFEGEESGNGLNHANIILKLASKLRRNRSVCEVIAITTAKVPIVKFRHLQTGLECDISLYNTLAQRNTQLLHLYSKIDPRVKILGYTMKFFAKVCDIGDASRGSLSSYAYILMVIYFLQQTKPPVIPVLQELYDKSKPAPEEIVQGWNVWFFKDISNLHAVWEFAGANKDSLGKLWLDLLKFYSEEFKFDNHVISIRQLKPLDRTEKLWIKKSIAIEDPFNLSHNLGSGLSRKMTSYILKTFILGRKMFGTPVISTPSFHQNILEYLFDQRQLTDGPLPNERCCRACGHIGHVARHCVRKPGTRDSDRRELATKPVKIRTVECGSKEKQSLLEHFATPNPARRLHSSPAKMVPISSNESVKPHQQGPIMRPPPGFPLKAFGMAPPPPRSFQNAGSRPDRPFMLFGQFDMQSKLNAYLPPAFPQPKIFGSNFLPPQGNMPLNFHGSSAGNVIVNNSLKQREIVVPSSAGNANNLHMGSSGRRPFRKPSLQFIPPLLQNDGISKSASGIRLADNWPSLHKNVNTS